ncbi:MAG: hypothetical protein LBC41_03265 [Clostridiales bacterium]|jgi:hypothetical protein|nr:hypothetical protein [Clostridiales bacterium]
MDDYEKLAKSYYDEAIKAVQDGDPSKGLTLLAMACDNIKDDSQSALYLKILSLQDEIQDSLDDSQVSEERRETLKGREARKESQSLETKIEELTALINAEKVAISIKYAESIDTSSDMGNTPVAADFWLALARAYLQRPETHSAKAKKAIIKAKSVLESCNGADPSLMIRIYVDLSIVAMSNDSALVDKQLIIGYCKKAWELAGEIGYDSCDAVDLYSVCTFASTFDPDHEKMWSTRSLQAAAEMLDSGKSPFDSAKMYAKSFKDFFQVGGDMHNLMLDKHVFECIKILESQPSLDDNDNFDLAIAYWLACYVRTHEKFWPRDNPSTEKTQRMLKHAVRLLKAQDRTDISEKDRETCDVMRALAHSYISTPYLGIGRNDLSDNELHKAIRIMNKSKGNPDTQITLDILKKGLSKHFGEE